MDQIGLVIQQLIQTTSYQLGKTIRVIFGLAHNTKGHLNLMGQHGQITTGEVPNYPEATTNTVMKLAHYLKIVRGTYGLERLVEFLFY